MNDIKKLIMHIFLNSIEDVYLYDGVNIGDGVSEWNICARLAMYFEKRMHAYDYLYRTELFKDYYADVEYNRSINGSPKEVDGQKVRCDMLVQTREETKYNYLVLELKKPDNQQKRVDDIREIKRMVMPRQQGTTDYYNCGTHMGIFMDYNKEKYWGIVYWYDESTKNIIEKEFERGIVEEIIGSVFV